MSTVVAYISSRRRVNLPHVKGVVRSVICLQCSGPYSFVVNLLSLKGTASDCFRMYDVQK